MMCLEDRFLVALYDRNDFTPLKEIANSISITETALLSIVHRIVAFNPEYLWVKESERAMLLCPNKEIGDKIQAFVKEEGGFTTINQQEFLEYFKNELTLFEKLQELKQQLKVQSWIKWAFGIGLVVGGSIALVSHSRKHEVCRKELL